MVAVRYFAFLLGLSIFGQADWLERARTYLAQNQFAQAKSAAQEALKQNPKSADAEIVLGLVATAEEDLPEAVRRFEKATTLQPGNPHAFSYLGSTYLRQGKVPQARRVLQQALVLRPDSTTIRYNLGLAELAAGKPREALARFESVRRVQPSDIPALIGILECRLILGQSTAARTEVQRLRSSLAPNDPTLLAVAVLLAKYSDYETAIPLLEQLRGVSSESFEIAYNLSLALSNQKRSDEAVAAIRPFLNGSHAGEAYNLLATIETSRDKAAALTAYKEAARLSPQNENYVLDYGTALLDEQKPAEAVALFSKAASDFPRSSRIRIALGCAHYLSGAYEASARTLLDVLRIAPHSQPAYYLLGKSYDSAESLQSEIQQAFEKYVATNPRDVWAFTHYGMILFLSARAQGRKQFPEARRQLLNAIQRKGNFAMAHFQLGIVFDAEGKTSEATRCLERAASLDPQLAEAHYRLAMIYRRTGFPEKAQVASEKFQQLKRASEEKDRIAAITAIAAPTP